MRVFYANNNYAKYRIERANYLMAIIGASFYTFLTLALLFIILSSVFPDVYKKYLDYKIDSTLFGLIYVLISFSVLSISINESEIKENDFTKRYVDRIINFLIAYAITVIILIGLIGINFLPH